MKSILLMLSLTLSAAAFADNSNLVCHVADGSTFELQITPPMQDGSTLAIGYRITNGEKKTEAMLMGGNMKKDSGAAEAVQVYLDTAVTSGALKLTAAQKDSVTSIDLYTPYQPINVPGQPSPNGILVIRANANEATLASGIIHYTESQDGDEQITKVEPCL